MSFWQVVVIWLVLVVLVWAFVYGATGGDE